MLPNAQLTQINRLKIELEMLVNLRMTGKPLRQTVPLIMQKVYYLYDQYIFIELWETNNIYFIYGLETIYSLEID